MAREHTIVAAISTALVAGAAAYVIANDTPPKLPPETCINVVARRYRLHAGFCWNCTSLTISPIGTKAPSGLGKTPNATRPTANV